MKQRDDLDQMLSAWLDDPYTPPAPRYLGEVLERTRRTRQRPAWANLERWLPMAVITLRSATAPSLRIAWFLLITLLVLTLAAGVAFVGSQLLRGTAAIPQGGAAVLAFDAGGDIVTLRADGTDRRQLTSGPVRESSPSWSPDGTQIAYLSGQGDRSTSLAVMDAGGGNRTTLAETDQGTSCIPVFSELAWSPDGTSLVFPISAACDGRYDLFIVASDGSSPATKLVAPGMYTNGAAWSPRGTQIAFQGQGTSSAGLYVVDVGTGSSLAGGFPARRISDAGTYAAESWGRPQWSPDGLEVAAFAGTNIDCTQPTSGTTDAFVVKADGSGQRPIAAETAKEYLPTWAPDGRHLAFLRLVEPSEWVNGRPCTVAPWVVDVDGTNERRLEGIGPDPDVQPPSWSPDGTRIVGDLSTTNESIGLYIVTVDGSSPLVTLPDIDKGFASWQPVAVPLPPAPSFAAVSPSP